MKKSFSLIEILVAATLIVLLTATAVVAFTAFVKQSRDARRKADIEQIRTALEIYRSSNGTYPTDLASLTPAYILSIPKDPITGFVYSPFTTLPVGCKGIPAIPCFNYSITSDLESGGTYIAGPNGGVVSFPTPTPTPGCPAGETNPYYFIKNGMPCTITYSCGVTNCDPNATPTPTSTPAPTPTPGCPAGETNPYYFIKNGMPCTITYSCGVTNCVP